MSNTVNAATIGMCHALARLDALGCRVREARAKAGGEVWIEIDKPTAGQRESLKPISTRDRFVPGWIIFECEGMGIPGAVVRWEARMVREGV